MRKFKVGDKVLIQFKTMDSESIIYSKVWNGVVEELCDIEHDYLVMVEGDVHKLEEDWMSLDVQYYREERLNKILNKIIIK